MLVRASAKKLKREGVISYVCVCMCMCVYNDRRGSGCALSSVLAAAQSSTVGNVGIVHIAILS